jgi:hypothetical protein
MLVDSLFVFDTVKVLSYLYALDKIDDYMVSHDSYLDLVVVAAVAALVAVADDDDFDDSTCCKFSCCFLSLIMIDNNSDFNDDRDVNTLFLLSEHR